jgi:uncharacterized protein YdbL (DUF1318 family)
MIRVSLAFLTAVSLVATLGCVIRTQHTIDAHVTLDIRYIQDQADDVLDFIEGERQALPEIGPARQSSVFERVWDAVAPIRVAHAQELNTTSPAIRDLATRMRDRHPQVEALKNDGALGENNRGYVHLFDHESLSDAEKRNAAQQVVAAENADRKALYREIAVLNEAARVTVTQVERIYAQRRLDRGRTGERFQLPPAGKDFDTFKASEMGRKLGDDARPDAWVTLP